MVFHTRFDSSPTFENEIDVRSAAVVVGRTHLMATEAVG
jgi:hypothetical protein